MKRLLLTLFDKMLGARLAHVERILEKIMATQTELVAQLTAVNDQLKKIGTETAGLLAKIDELKAVIAAGTVSPELQAAVDALTAQAKVVDDLVADAPPVTP